MNDHPAQPVERPVGLETEYGVLKPGDPYANPVALASRLVAAYGAVSRPALARVEPGRGPRFLGFLPRAVLPAFFSVLRTARSEGRVRGADSSDSSVA